MNYSLNPLHSLIIPSNFPKLSPSLIPGLMARSNSITSQSTYPGRQNPDGVRLSSTEALMTVDDRFVKKSRKNDPVATYYFPNGEVFRPKQTPQKRPSNYPQKPSAPPPSFPRSNSMVSVSSASNPAKSFLSRSNSSKNLSSRTRSDLAHSIRSSKLDTITNIDIHRLKGPVYSHSAPAVPILPGSFNSSSALQPTPVSSPTTPTLSSSSSSSSFRPHGRLLSLSNNRYAENASNIVRLELSLCSDWRPTANAAAADTKLSDSKNSSISSYNLNRSNSTTPQTSVNTFDVPVDSDSPKSLPSSTQTSEKDRVDHETAPPSNASLDSIKEGNSAVFAEGPVCVASRTMMSLSTSNSNQSTIRVQDLATYSPTHQFHPPHEPQDPHGNNHSALPKSPSSLRSSSFSSANEFLDDVLYSDARDAYSRPNHLPAVCREKKEYNINGNEVPQEIPIQNPQYSSPPTLPSRTQYLQHNKIPQNLENSNPNTFNFSGYLQDETSKLSSVRASIASNAPSAAASDWPDPNFSCSPLAEPLPTSALLTQCQIDKSNSPTSSRSSPPPQFLQPCLSDIPHSLNESPTSNYSMSESVPEEPIFVNPVEKPSLSVLPELPNNPENDGNETTDLVSPASAFSFAAGEDVLDYKKSPVLAPPPKPSSVSANSDRSLSKLTASTIQQTPTSTANSTSPDPTLCEIGHNESPNSRDRSSEQVASSGNPELDNSKIPPSELDDSMGPRDLAPVSLQTTKTESAKPEKPSDVETVSPVESNPSTAKSSGTDAITAPLLPEKSTDSLKKQEKKGPLTAAEGVLLGDSFLQNRLSMLNIVDVDFDKSLPSTPESMRFTVKTPDKTSPNSKTLKTPSPQKAPLLRRSPSMPKSRSMAHLKKFLGFSRAEPEPVTQDKGLGSRLKKKFLKSTLQDPASERLTSSSDPSNVSVNSGALKKPKKGFFKSIMIPSNGSKESDVPTKVYNVRPKMPSPVLEAFAQSPVDYQKYNLPQYEADSDDGFGDLLSKFDAMEEKLELEAENIRSKARPMDIFMKDDELTKAQIADQQRKDQQMSDENLPRKFDTDEEDKISEDDEEKECSESWEGNNVGDAADRGLHMVGNENGGHSVRLDRSQLNHVLDGQDKSKYSNYIKHARQMRDMDLVEIVVDEFRGHIGDIPSVKQDVSLILKKPLTSDHRADSRKGVKFSGQVSISETYAPHMYRRYNKSVTQYYLSGHAEVNRIKNELNAYKCHEMLVHEKSQNNTHFFY